MVNYSKTGSSSQWTKNRRHFIGTFLEEAAPPTAYLSTRKASVLEQEVDSWLREKGHMTFSLAHFSRQVKNSTDENNVNISCHRLLKIRITNE